MSKKDKLKQKNIKFIINSLGCKVNQYDSALLKRELINRGFIEANNDDLMTKKVDLIIVNTCTVTKKAITKDRQLSHELSRIFPKAQLVVMGCWPQTDDLACQSFSNDIIFWGVGRLSELADNLQKKFKLSGLLESNLIVTTDKARYFLKVGDGCNQFCSYCLIPFARGRLKSRSVQELFFEVELAVKNGFQEIVLSGIHLGRYGEDGKNKKINLVFLLKKLLTIKNLGRLRLSSIEVNEVSDELIELISREKRICHHLHISLQSGCDKILTLMKRPYDTNFFIEKIKSLRKKIPDIAISTDIIVGFPSETLIDFKKTISFVKKIKFSKIHVFPFSAHEKTLAYKLTDKVKPEEIKRRSKILRTLADVLEKEYQTKIIRRYKKIGLLTVIEGYGFINNKIPSRLKGTTEFSFNLDFSLDKIKLDQSQDLKNLKVGQIVRVLLD